jgi:DNA-binding PadR family transcriptional regulator
MHGHCESHGGRWAVGRHRRGRFGGYGFGRRHGMGGEMGPEDLRAGRMLAQGDLRLIALALIAQEPRHGYEIIKLVEEKTADWYSPSPGIVYPTLTYLEEAGYVTASVDGTKKLYTITEEGRAYLTDHRDVADAILKRLDAVGQRVARDYESMSRSITGAFQDLSEAVRDLLRQDREAKGRVIDVIDRATNELRQK